MPPPVWRPDRALFVLTSGTGRNRETFWVESSGFVGDVIALSGEDTVLDEAFVASVGHHELSPEAQAQRRRALERPAYAHCVESWLSGLIEALGTDPDAADCLRTPVPVLTRILADAASFVGARPGPFRLELVEDHVLPSDGTHWGAAPDLASLRR